jgi:hypothetical protein
MRRKIDLLLTVILSELFSLEAVIVIKNEDDFIGNVGCKKFKAKR